MSRSALLVRFILSIALLFGTTGPALAQPAADTTRRTAPNSDLPLIPTRPLKFTTDEGTWISLDVSPDGRMIVFDLLGDIYTIPITGGSATRITSGSGFDGQPRFSPDGKSIVFVTDRSGSENLYLIDRDGSHLRSLTRGPNQAFVSPAWTPDGQYVVVSKSNDLWLYHRDGGSGLRLTGQTPAPQQGGPGGGNAPSNFMGASATPDGRYIYASARTGPAGYNQMMATTQVVMYDRQTGRLDRRTLNLGTGFRPQVSPDGKWLAYGSRRMAVTGLKLRELSSGDEKWLASDIQRDDIESRGSRDLLPGFAWTPDSKALVLAHHGHIWRVDAATGQQTQIPFTAEVDQMLGELVRFEYPVNDTSLTVRQIRGARPSPNGKRLVFSALDRLWIMDLPSGTPKRLTTSDEGEHSPVWSPDGKYIAYVSWTEDGGDIWRIPAAGGRPEKLTRQSAFYEDVTYSPTGSRIVAVRAPREQRAEINDEINPKLVITDLVWIPAGCPPAKAGSPPAGGCGAATLISPLTNADRPHFSNDTTRVWIYDDDDGLVSMRWDGTDRKAHLIVTGYQQPGGGPNARPRRAAQLHVSPDGTRVLALVDNKIFVIPLAVTGGQTPTVSVEQPNNSAIPFRRLSRIGGDFLGWNADSKGVFYSMGRSFFQYDLARADSLAADSAAKAPPRPARSDSTPNANAPARGGRPVYEPARTDITITATKDRPTGTVVLRGARIITMKGDEVIPRGDVVVTNNRIVAVGAEGSVTVPNGARTIDVSGKTIMPGLVDVHAHMWPQWGVHSPQPYMYTVNLAYGVTTTRDPQTSTADVITYGDAVDVGQIVGPRIYTTGPGIFNWDNVTSGDDAKEVMKRYSEFYLTETIKQYMAGDRRQRQWIAMAAKEQRITPTLEGGLDFKKNMTEAMDGYAGIEHTLPIAPMYKDAIQLFAKSGTTWTPTLLVQYGGPWAENWWYEHYDILSDAKLTHFTPFSELERRALRRPQWFRDSEYSFKLFAEQAKKVVEAGGRVGLGGHGQLQGLGVHWELWNIASGGMKPMDVLRVGTIYGAESIGLGKEIGSLEGGKLADLMVLDGNPLDDIKNTNTIRMVMKNGRLYDGNTLAEVWPRQRALPKQWWMTHDRLAPADSGSAGGGR